MTRAKHAPAVSPTLPTVRIQHRQENMKCHGCSARGMGLSLAEVGAPTLENLEDHLRVAVDAPPSSVCCSSRSERLRTTSKHILRTCVRMHTACVCTLAAARSLEDPRVNKSTGGGVSESYVVKRPTYVRTLTCLLRGFGLPNSSIPAPVGMRCDAKSCLES